MKALVTGGGGFLGGAIVRHLLRAGARVRTFARGEYPALDALGVETLRGDLQDRQAVWAACRGCDVVFHVAAKAGIWGPYRAFYGANVIGTQNVIAACREAGVGRLVYTSSPSVIFDGADMEGADETVPYPKRYNAAYPATKAAAEQLVVQANDDSLATVCLRPHAIWGPHDTHLIPGLLARAKTGRLRLIREGTQRIDFTYVDNAALAHVLAARRLQCGTSLAGRVYFISDGKPVELRTFVNEVLAAANLPPIRASIPPKIAYLAGAVCELVYALLRRRSDPPVTRFLAQELATSHWFDISAAAEDLGYRPQVTFEQGMSNVRQWLSGSDRPPAFPYLQEKGAQ